MAAEARAAAGRAAAAERGQRGDRHGRLAARRHRPVLLGVLRAGHGSSCSSAIRTSRPGRRPRSPTATSTAIVQRFGLGVEAEVTQVERGQADWVVDDVPADRLRGAAQPLRPQVHVNPLPADWYVALNVNIKPFNQIKARQAVNLAIDRDEIVKLFGGAQLRRADVPGAAAGLPRLRALLPLDAERQGALVGARSRARARSSSTESGTKGDRVDIVVANDRRAEGDRQVHSGRALQARLRPAPQGAARRRAGRRTCRTRATASRSGSRSGSQEYPAPSDAARRPARLRLLRAGLRREPQHQRLLRPHDGAAADAARGRARPHAPAGRRAAVASGRPPRHRSRRVDAALQPEAHRPRLAPRRQLPLEPAAAPHAVPALGEVDERRGTRGAAGASS